MTDLISQLKEDEKNSSTAIDYPMHTKPETLDIAEYRKLAKDRKSCKVLPSGWSIAKRILIFSVMFLLGVLFVSSKNVFFSGFAIHLLFLGTVGGVLSIFSLLRQVRFNFLRRDLVEATVVHRWVTEGSRGKGGGKAYSYYIIFAFKIPRDGVYVFKKHVSERSFEQTQIGERLQVEYAVNAPWLARHC